MNAKTKITIPPLTFEVEDIKPRLKRPEAKIRRDLEKAIRERLDDWAFLSICWGYEIEARLVSEKPIEETEENDLAKIPAPD